MDQLKKMPRTTIMLIGFLGALTVGLVFLALYIKPFENVKTPETSKGKKQASYAHTTLKIGDPIQASTTSAAYSSDVDIETGENKITAVQIELSYDPEALTNVDIKPGVFVPNALVLLKKIDPVEGRITLALALPLGQKGIQGQGNVAVITFTQKENSTSAVNFLPKTQVTAEGISQSVLKSTTGNIFNLSL